MERESEQGDADGDGHGDQGGQGQAGGQLAPGVCQAALGDGQHHPVGLRRAAGGRAARARSGPVRAPPPALRRRGGGEPASGGGARGKVQATAGAGGAAGPIAIHTWARQRKKRGRAGAGAAVARGRGEDGRAVEALFGFPVRGGRSTSTRSWVCVETSAPDAHRRVGGQLAGQGVPDLRRPAP